MLPESTTAVIARNERWAGSTASEPYEAGWAREATIFLRSLKEPTGTQPRARVEMSPDGMHWLPEGTELQLPAHKDGVSMARIVRFGNWLRIAAEFEPGAESTVLVTIHLKA